MANANLESNEKSFLDSDVCADFRDPNIYHDRVLLVEGVKFYVTSGHLSFASEFFRGLFNSNFKEKDEWEICLEDVEAEDFSNFLKFVYPSDSVVNVTNVDGLMKLSCRFLAPSVWQKCMKFIREADNLLKLNKHHLLIYSEKSGSNELKNKIEDAWIVEFAALSENEKKIVTQSALTFSLSKLKVHIETILSRQFNENTIPDDMGLWRYIFANKYNFEVLKKSIEEFTTRMYEEFRATGQITLLEKAAPTSRIKKLYEKYLFDRIRQLKSDHTFSSSLLVIASKYHFDNLLAAMSDHLIQYFAKNKSFKDVEVAIEENCEKVKKAVAEYLVSTGFDALSDREKEEIYEAKPAVQKFILSCFVKNKK